jgi:aminoglycoside phosphotransferase
VKELKFKTAAQLQKYVRRRPPKAWHVVVVHDNACSPLACTCSPEYILEDLTVANVERAIREEREWKKASLS